MVDFDRLSQVSHATSFLDVLDHYGIEYQTNGTDRYKILCPFHNDHSPSLIVYTNETHDKDSYCCYVDNNAGDVFHFIRNMEDGDFQQSWSILCMINNIEDSEALPIDNITSLLKVKADDSRPVSLINAELSTLYRRLYYIKKAILPPPILQELVYLIDKNLQDLDNYLDSSPSFIDLQKYRKVELDKIKSLQLKFKEQV